MLQRVNVLFVSKRSMVESCMACPVCAQVSGSSAAGRKLKEIEDKILEVCVGPPVPASSVCVHLWFGRFVLPLPDAAWCPPRLHS